MYMLGRVKRSVLVNRYSPITLIVHDLTPNEGFLSKITSIAYERKRIDAKAYIKENVGSQPLNNYLHTFHKFFGK